MEGTPILNPKFTPISNHRPRNSSRLESLPTEILHCIVAHVQAVPEVSRLESRAWLSVESLQQPPSALADNSANIDVRNLSYVSRAILPITRAHLFKRITINSFERRGKQRSFDTLYCISQNPEICQLVQTFSYMVRPMYLPDYSRIEDLRETIGEDKKLERFLSRALDQLDMWQQKTDINLLKRAIGAFTNLQHIRVLRLTDELDRAIMAHLVYLKRCRNVLDAESLVCWDWHPAFVRACRTLGYSVSSSNSTRLSRLSFPVLDIASASILLNGSWNPVFSSMATHLQCLVLKFDAQDRVIDGTREGFITKFHSLSPLFLRFFKAAPNLVSIHIGFVPLPQRLLLEDVFHNTQLVHLKVFSIVGWCLEADEIMAFVRRHKQRLVGLRLGVRLQRPNSRWKDVLSVLREELLELRWLSLSSAGYSSTPSEIQNIINDDLDPPSDEEYDDSWNGEHGEHSESTGGNGFLFPEEHGNGNDSDIESSVDSVSSSDPPARSLITTLSETPEFAYACTCMDAVHNLSKDQLGDDSAELNIPALRRKMWERWVVGCPVHRNRHQNTAGHDEH